MTIPDPLADELALRRLATDYALAADHGDADRYAGVFQADAQLRVYRMPELDTPMSTITGHDQLRQVPSVLAKSYDRTFHFVGQCAYELDGDRATGEVYCLAHHLTVDRHGGTSYVMHMRYLDAYQREPDGQWKITERIAHIDWTETRAANPPAT